MILKDSKEKGTVYATRNGLEEANGNEGWRFNGSIREFVVFDPIFGWLSKDAAYELRQKDPRLAP